MLILTRRVGESLIIGDDITVQIIGIRSHQVRIAIHAPKEIPVDREEVAIRKRQEREAT